MPLLYLLHHPRRSCPLLRSHRLGCLRCSGCRPLGRGTTHMSLDDIAPRHPRPQLHVVGELADVRGWRGSARQLEQRYWFQMPRRSLTVPPFAGRLLLFHCRVEVVRQVAYLTRDAEQPLGAVVSVVAWPWDVCQFPFGGVQASSNTVVDGRLTSSATLRGLVGAERSHSLALPRTASSCLKLGSVVALGVPDRLACRHTAKCTARQAHAVCLEALGRSTQHGHRSTPRSR